MLASDISNLSQEVKRVIAAGADEIHLDIMYAATFAGQAVVLMVEIQTCMLS